MKMKHESRTVVSNKTNVTCLYETLMYNITFETQSSVGINRTNTQHFTEEEILERFWSFAEGHAHSYSGQGSGPGLRSV